nr:14210_t:CDS:10 [Entrophospora candida]
MDIPNLLEQLTKNIYQYDLHVQYIQALRQAGLFEELKDARKTMHEIFPMSEELWLEWIDDEAHMASTKEAKQRIIHIFSEAVQDYLSINIWKKYADFMVQEYNDSEELMEECSENSFITLDQVRKVFDQAIREINYFITQSNQIWDAYMDFEEKILEKTPSDETQKNLSEIIMEKFLLAIEKTWMDYSTFITNYDNLNYEKNMLEAIQIYNKAKDMYYKRDQYEQSLLESGYALQQFLDYINFEKKQKLHPAVLTLYERALSIHYLEPALWEDYIFYLSEKKASHILAKVAERSVRNCLWSGDLWGHYIRILEKSNDVGASDQIDDVVKSCIAIGMLNSVDEYLKMILAYCDYKRRKLNIYQDLTNQQSLSDLIEFIEEQLKLLNQVFRDGDPHYRLEKYLIEMETLKKDIPKSHQTWEKIISKHRNESEVWLQYANWEKSLGNIEQARKIFKNASHQNTDWPERIFNEWEQFEHHYGTLDTIESAHQFIRKQSKIVTHRREKAVLQTQAEDPSFKMIESEQSTKLVEIRDSSGDELNKKRKAKEELLVEETPSTKRNKGQNHEKIKRDREFATVIVSNLPQDVTEGKLKSMFHDCGKIREVRLKNETDDSQKLAFIEFVNRESVLAALTKDKKRIDENEISVYRTSERTLFVTNFPESTDLHELFKKYGEIIEIRVPNKVVKKRRFAYVEFKDRVFYHLSHSALELNDYELVSGEKLIVLVSDPSLKKARSPSSSNRDVLQKSEANKKSDQLKSFTVTVPKPRPFKRPSAKIIAPKKNPQSLLNKEEDNNFKAEATIQMDHNNDSSISSSSGNKKTNADFRNMFLQSKK